MRLLRSTAIVLLLATIAMAAENSTSSDRTTTTTTMKPGSNTGSDRTTTVMPKDTPKPNSTAGDGGDRTTTTTTKAAGYPYPYGNNTNGDGTTTTTTTMKPGSNTGSDRTTTVMPPKETPRPNSTATDRTTTTMMPPKETPKPDGTVPDRMATTTTMKPGGGGSDTPAPTRQIQPALPSPPAECPTRLEVYPLMESGTRVAKGSTEPLGVKGLFTAMCKDASALLTYTFTAQPKVGDRITLPSRGPKASLAELAEGTYVVVVAAQPASALTDREKAAGAQPAAAMARIAVTIFVPEPRITPKTATTVKVSSTAGAGKFMLAADVENMGANTAAWSCCQIQAVASTPTTRMAPTCDATCPAALKKAVAATTVPAIAVATSDALAVGQYRMTLTVGPTARAFYVNVVAEPVVRVALHKSFDARADAFAFFASSSADVTLSWKVNGVAVDTATSKGQSLTLSRKSLADGMETTVEVTATRGTSSTSASVTLPAPINAVVNCVVSRDDGATDAAVPLATRLRIKAAASGFNVSQIESIQYRFGFARWKAASSAADAAAERAVSAKAAAEADELADMTPVYLSTAPATVDEYNTTAPLVVPSSTTAASAADFEVRFFVEVTINKDIRVRGVCRHRVARLVATTKADADKIADDERKRAVEAVEAGDEDAVAETVANAITVSDESGSAQTNVTARAELASKLMTVLAQAARGSRAAANATPAPTPAGGSSTTNTAAVVADGTATDMSAETKANYVDVLSRMDLSALRKARRTKLETLRNQSVANATTTAETPAAEAQTDAAIDAACDAACKTAMKADVMAIVRAVLAPSKDGTRVDARANGQQLLNVLSAVAPDAETSKAAVDIASTLAAQTPVGETSQIESDSITIVGATFPAPDGVAAAPSVETKDGSKFTWPAGAALPTAAADSTVSLAAVQQTTNARPSTGLRASEAPVARVTDFKVAVDGVEAKIANLTVPIRCAIKRLTARNATRNTTVRYYDESMKEWRTDGITDVVETDAEVTFNVNHLTGFGAFEDQGSSSSAAGPSAANPPPAVGPAATPAGNPPAGTPPPAPAGTPGANTPAVTPPAGNPPAGTPPPAPAGTPGANTPAGNPPAGTPPAGNPPAGNPPASNPPAGGTPAATPAATPAGTATPGNPPAGAPTDDSEESGLSTGAKIGIGAGSVILVAAIAGMFLAARRASAQPPLSTSEEVLLEMPRASVGEAFTSSPAPYRASSSSAYGQQPAAQPKSMLSGF